MQIDKNRQKRNDKRKQISNKQAEKESISLKKEKKQNLYQKSLLYLNLCTYVDTYFKYQVNKV